MKPPRLPLYAQFLVWLLLNLVLLTGLLIAFASRDGFGLEMLLTDPARERAQAVGYAVSRQLEASDAAEWPRELAEFGASYGATFTLERPRPRGDRGGPPGPAPPNGWRRMDDGGLPRGPFEPGEERPPPEFGRQRPQRPDPPPNGAFVRLMRTSAGYQLRIPLALNTVDPAERRELAVTTGGLWPLLRFLGLSGWIRLVLGALLLSALWWWPLVYGITRRIGRLTRITERIAQGHLTDRADPGRPDELARLANSVNRMGQQLHAQVQGQRQFLLDVAHELTSPLARMQVGLAIAQDELPAADAQRLTPVLADAQQMSDLLQDLLQFSRSEGGVSAPRLQTLDVHAVLREVCSQESADAGVRLTVPPGLAVLADRALLVRALANLVRNALRHGAGSMVEIDAVPLVGAVRISVSDRGPGVPDSALAHLGEPFYRPDVARDRNTGGVGLGLAIVRRSIERCGGELRLANRQGGGFEALVELPLPGGAGSGGASPRE